MALKLTPNQRIAALAVVIFVLDQITKVLVLRYLDYAQHRDIIPGFFKFVHWGNTGAAWSMFHGNNELLAIISLIALLVLFLTRHHFDSDRLTGQIALGLIFGGIAGNVLDRLLPSRGHVIDFIYFYVERRGGGEVGFPAFNIADSAICCGVALMFLLSWLQERDAAPTAGPAERKPAGSKP